jgi:hypothetical protein
MDIVYCMVSIQTGKHKLLFIIALKITRDCSLSKNAGDIDNFNELQFSSGSCDFIMGIISCNWKIDEPSESQFKSQNYQ